jgi:RimJ/RimL family protein N-acetyltransferase
MPRERPFTIRPYQLADVRSQRRWPRFTDPLLLSYNLTIPPHGEADYFHNRCQREDYLRWAVDDHRGRLLAVVSLREIDRNAGVARLGITIRPDRLSRGYGRRILRRFIAFYFRDLGFRRMVLDVAMPNRRAIRCYRRLGFTLTGHHWQMHSAGGDPSADRAYRELGSAFRRRGHVLEVRFLDMEIDPPRFLAANPDLAGSCNAAGETCSD